MIKYVILLSIILSCSNNSKLPEKKELLNIDTLLSGSWVSEFEFQNYKEPFYRFNSSNSNSNISGLLVKISDSIIKLEFMLVERTYKVEIKCDRYLFSDTNFICIGKDEKQKNIEILRLNFKDSVMLIGNSLTKNVLQSDSNWVSFRKISNKELLSYEFVNWGLDGFFESKKFTLKQKGKADKEITTYYKNDIFFKSDDKGTVFFIQKIDYLLDSSMLKKLEILLQFNTIENANWVPFVVVKNNDKSIDFYESDRGYKKMLKRFTIVPF